jgi:hypothetical protein
MLVVSAERAAETRGMLSKTSDLSQLFCNELALSPHIMRQTYGGPKLPQELRDQFGGMYRIA